MVDLCPFIMSRLIEDHYFMKASLSFERAPNFPLDGRQVKAIILHALQTLHGQVGAAIPVDVLKCCPVSNRDVNIILRLTHSELVKVWSSLTLLGAYNGTTCVFSVQKASGSLMSLGASSRDFDFPV